MKNITFNNIFCIIILLVGFIVNSSLMWAMLTSFIVSVILFSLSIGNNINPNNITDILDNDDFKKKADGVLTLCACAFITFTIIIYNLLTNSTIYGN